MTDEQRYLRDVQYRFPDRLQARAVLHTRYGRGDWFAWLAAHIPLAAGSTIADIGCGAGAFWTNAPADVPDDLTLRLFELSPGMVDAARTALASLGRWTNVQTDVEDATALPLADATVDTAMAIHMLYHLADPAQGIAEMARVLRAGGTAAVVLNPAGTMAELSALVRAALGDAYREQPRPLSSEDGAALMRARFDRVTVLRYDDMLRVTDPVDLLGYLGSLPYAEADGAMVSLARAIEMAFDRGSGTVTISKASELIIGVK